MKGKIEKRDVGFAAAGMAIAIVIGLAVFVYSGIYNVSAARPHLDPTVWLLDTLRRQSISFHSRSVEVPPLDDEGLIRLGALHFAEGCAGCHGAPGRPANAITNAMLPEPPSLPASVADWSTGALFWIVRNGQKYTGMPAWIAPERTDEVWAVIAFLKHLGPLDAAGYDALVGTESRPASGVPVVMGRSRNAAELLAYCSGCHGMNGADPVADAVPTIGGQLRSYLVRTLGDYRTGARDSGIMQLAASTLTESEITALADHFAGVGLRPRENGGFPDDAVIRGAAIFNDGLPQVDVPACNACHDNGADEAIPRLLGQSAAFIRQQLELWRQDIRGETGYEAIMAPVAHRLTPQQVADVAAYIASARTPAEEAQR